MGLDHRRRRRLGPLPVWRHSSRSGRGRTTSWTVELFGVSCNSRTRTKTVDLPGNWSSTTG
jgi:hypothetical protein